MVSKRVRQRALSVVIFHGGYLAQVNDYSFWLPLHVVSLEAAIEAWGYFNPYTPNAEF